MLEGEERYLKAWDFVHCPPMAEHIFVGAGAGPCVIVMAGRRRESDETLYPVNEAAAKHDAVRYRGDDEPRGGVRAFPTGGAGRAYEEGRLP